MTTTADYGTWPKSNASNAAFVASHALVASAHALEKYGTARQSVFAQDAEYARRENACIFPPISKERAKRRPSNPALGVLTVTCNGSR